MKIISICILLFVLILLPNLVIAGELEHIIKDSDMMFFDDPIWDKTNCISGEEHLFITLSKKDWFKIGEWKGKIEVPFHAQFCIKCRLIPVSCSGNDWYRYKVEKSE